MENKNETTEIQKTNWVTKTAVLYTVIVIALWVLPEAPKWPGHPIAEALKFNDLKVRPWLRRFVYNSGIWQIWNMFSYDPNTEMNTWLNHYYDFEVLYEDGRTRRIPYPRMFEMSQWDRIPALRYQKYMDTCQPKTNSYLIDPFVQRFVHSVIRGESEVPKRVRLYETWVRIGAPGEADYRFPESKIYDQAYRGDRG